MSVAIIFSCVQEAEFLIKEQSLKLEILGSFQKALWGNDLIIISGIGKSNAAAACAKCYQLGYKKIINAGICGALNDSFKLLDVIKPNVVIDLDKPDFDKSLCQLGFQNSFCDDVRLGSISYPVHSETSKEHFARTADILDMEAYAIAMIAKTLELKLGFLKCVSDFCSSNGKELIQLNLPMASQRLTEEIYDIKEKI